MKKLMLLLFSLSVFGLCQAGSLTTIKVNSTAGGLATAITSAGADLTTVTNLAVTGAIDARDFKTMRDDMPALTDIDLSAVSVEAYTGTEGTFSSNSISYIANEAPGRAFKSNSIITSIVLPNTVTTLGNSLFYGCSSLSSVTIPSSITELPDYCFYGCTSLTSFDIPSTVTSLSSGVFRGCSSLSSVTIPSSITELPYYCFYGCTSLTSFVLPNTVTTLGISLFYGCSSLSTVTIPSSITELPISCFNNCTSLTLINIPSTVTNIEPYAFSGCNSLASVIISSQQISIGYAAFDKLPSNSIVEVSSDELNLSSGNSFPSTGALKLTANTSIIDEPLYLKGVASSFVIDELNPSYCTDGWIVYNKDKTKLLVASLECEGRYEIPSTVDSIANGAFAYCDSLTSVVIPASVTAIGDTAFYECRMLDTIYSYASSPQVLTLVDNSYYRRVFAGVDTTSCVLCVPKGSKAAYQSADQWKSFQNIIEMDDTTADIESANTSSVNAFVSNGELKVEGLIEGTQMVVYTVDGVLVASDKATGESFECLLPKRGVYIVRAGDEAVKVLY